MLIRPTTILLIIMAMMGCRAKPRVLAPATSSVTTRPVLMNKPAIDFAKGSTGLPIDTSDKPQTVENLKIALIKAYAERMSDTSPLPKVEATGTSIHSIDLLRIDLSDCQLPKDYNPKPGPEITKFDPMLHIDRLEYIASPLKFHTYSTNVDLVAKDVTLTMVPASEKGKSLLCMTDCESIHATFSAKMDDFRQSVLVGAKVRTSITFGVDEVQLDMKSDSPRSLEITMSVQARLLILPARFSMTGRVDIDDDFNVQFSKLQATGYNPAGNLIASLIQERLVKYNNKAAPLCKFPGDKIKMTDFNIKLDDTITVKMSFGRR